MKSLFTLLACLATPSALALEISIPATDGREPAVVQLPDNPAERDAWPLVLMLHGFSPRPDYINGFFGINAEASRRGFVLVVPKGRKSSLGPRFWSATDGCCDFEKTRGDDVAYLTGLLREVGTRVKVDPRRIYVIGHSNGGFMAHRLACDTSGLFAAVVSFAGVTWKDPANCTALDGLSLLQVHAVDDATVRYVGDKGFPTLAPYPGAEETVARYVERNGCLAAPAEGTMDLVTSLPGADTSTRTWNGCRNGTEVAIWKTNAGGKNAHNPAVTAEFRAKLLDFLLSKSR